MTQDPWTGLGLSGDLRDALFAAEFETPSPIQTRSIPPQLDGRDILALAQTGSGKTAAFILPMLQHLAAEGGRPAPKSARCLILAPTRELAVQIEETAKLLRGRAKISTLLVLGGMSRNAQVRALHRGVDILIATPGRLSDLMAEGHVRFDQTRTLVLDEADRMLDMGFVKQVQMIAAKLHPKRRTALFSATMPSEVAKLAAGLMSDPVEVEIARSGTTAAKITQSVELLPRGAKRARLAEILSQPDVDHCIVFARTKRGADRVAQNLGKDGIPAGAIHGNKSQNARQRVLNQFRAGELKVLVASDIAARGIDVPGITHVVQFELPDEAEAYVHRIGRTGRNGAEGVAIALCCEEEWDKLRAIEKLTKRLLVPEEERPAGLRPGVAAAPAPKRGGKPKPNPKQGGKPRTGAAAKPKAPRAESAQGAQGAKPEGKSGERPARRRNRRRTRRPAQAAS